MIAINDEFTALPISAQHKWQLRARRDGKCVKCGVPCLPFKMCERHRKASNLRLKTHDPLKYNARRAVADALARGEIFRGSCHCGKLGFAHHADYSKPLDITWLCHQHHYGEHGQETRTNVELLPRDYKAEKRAANRRSYLTRKMKRKAILQ